MTHTHIGLGDQKEELYRLRALVSPLNFPRLLRGNSHARKRIKRRFPEKEAVKNALHYALSRARARSQKRKCKKVHIFLFLESRKKSSSQSRFASAPTNSIYVRSMLSNRESATHCVALPDDKGGETDTHNMALKPVRAAGPIQVVAAR